MFAHASSRSSASRFAQVKTVALDQIFYQGRLESYQRSDQPSMIIAVLR